jgi:hypothetical protein
MRRQRLNILSPIERAELNRHLKDAMDASLIRPTYMLANSFCAQSLWLAASVL